MESLGKYYFFIFCLKLNAINKEIRQFECDYEYDKFLNDTTYIINDNRIKIKNCSFGEWISYTKNLKWCYSCIIDNKIYYRNPIRSLRYKFKIKA